MATASRTHRLAIASARVLALVTGALSVTRFALEGVASLVGLVLAVTALSFLLLSLVLGRSQRPLAFFVPILGLGGVSGMALVDGGAYSEALFWAPFIPLVAALFSGGRGAIALAGATLAAITLIFTRQALGGVASPPASGALFLRYFGLAGAVLFGGALGCLYERVRGRREAALAVSEARHRALVASLPDVVLRLDRNGVILDRSVAQFARWGLANADAASIRGVFDPQTVRVIRGQLADCLDDGELTTFVHRTKIADELRDLEIRLNPVGEDEAVALVRDITERLRAERAKREFVSMVSHELRTPLTSIHGALALVAQSPAGLSADKQSDLLGVALRNSKRLTRLINDLLDVQKIEAGYLDFDFADVDIGDIVEAAVAEHEPAATQAKVELRINENSRAAPLTTDVNRCHQVISNLLSNAVKHSPSMGVVEIELDINGAEAWISVADQGAGIPEEFRSHVFEPFSQADPSSTRSVGGTGLGLAIARDIATLLGGRLSFETETGVGTTFTFKLPLRQPVPEIRSPDAASAAR